MTIIAPIEHLEILQDRFGRRVQIIGTVLLVDEIAAMHNNGCTVEWFLENYDDLTPAKVYAALAFYYDNKEEIDERNRARDEYVAQRAIPSDEHLKQIRERHAQRQKSAQG